MTRVDFYLLEDVEEAARHRFACRLVGRAAGTGKRVHLRTATSDVAAIDELLWEYPRDRFLPHARHAPGEAPFAPVAIGAESERPGHRQLLINLTAGIPDFVAGFERVCEIIVASARAEGRAKYREYRDRGYPLFHHEIDDWE